MNPTMCGTSFEEVVGVAPMNYLVSGHLLCSCYSVVILI